ncbi:MAG: 5'/3'-nucleotidase SurE [Spirochaetales bacterium]|nr:5'/3'-nucleotidase SurE [Spirochaetales bacterium]
MRILITNDDGIHSDGLLELTRQLNRNHDVWVVAPESEMSGSSHAISINRPLRVKQVNQKTFSCVGTPADCILLGLQLFVKDRVDVVISGINRGPNLGTDTIYSGTVAAARQAALMGVPAVAASVMGKEGVFHFGSAASYITRYLKELIQHSNPDHFVNINFPVIMKEPWETEITIPSRRIYKNAYATFQAPDGYTYCFLHGENPSSKEEEGFDFTAISNGRVSLSPMVIHPKNHEIEEMYKELFAHKENVNL